MVNTVPEIPSSSAAVASSPVRSQRPMLPAPTRVLGVADVETLAIGGPASVGDRCPPPSQVVMPSAPVITDSGANSLERGRITDSGMAATPASGVRAKARPEGIWAYDVTGRPPSVPAARLSRLPYSYAVAVLRLGTGSPVAPRSRRASAISGRSPNRRRPHPTPTMSATARPIRARPDARDAPPTDTRAGARRSGARRSHHARSRA